MEETLFGLFYQFPLLMSFAAGVLSFLSPCILPLVPAYMSYISGVSVHSLQDGQYSRFGIFLRALFFVIGFGVVFMSIGLAIGYLIEIVQSRIVSIIAGGIVIAFGLHFLGIFRIKWLYRTKRLDLQVRHPALQILAPFVLGVSFALGWTPCTGPIFGAITLVASTTPSYGTLLLGLYTFGLALPFLLLALILEWGLNLLQTFKQYMRHVEVISGVLLVLIGILIMSDSLNMISL